MPSRLVGSALTLDTEVAWEEREERAGGRNVGSHANPMLFWALRASSAPVPWLHQSTFKALDKENPQYPSEVSGARQKCMGEERMALLLPLG